MITESNAIYFKREVIKVANVVIVAELLQE